MWKLRPDDARSENNPPDRAGSVRLRRFWRWAYRKLAQAPLRAPIRNLGPSHSTSGFEQPEIAEGSRRIAPHVANPAGEGDSQRTGAKPAERGRDWRPRMLRKSRRRQAETGVWTRGPPSARQDSRYRRFRPKPAENGRPFAAANRHYQCITRITVYPSTVR